MRMASTCSRRIKVDSVCAIRPHGRNIRMASYVYDGRVHPNLGVFVPWGFAPIPPPTISLRARWMGAGEESTTQTRGRRWAGFWLGPVSSGSSGGEWHATFREMRGTWQFGSQGKGGTRLKSVEAPIRATYRYGIARHVRRCSWRSQSVRAG